jgi:AcrR family transcriptional regulator
MKIGELCSASGLSRSTIHNYLRMGLLPPPTKVGLNLHLYGTDHLETLQKIKYLKETKGLSLAGIRDALNGTDPIEVPDIGAIDWGNGPTEKEKIRERKNGKNDQIVAKAISLFSEQGYEQVRVSDITDALHMGKGTFYLYFENKQDLLLACFKRLRSLIQPLEERDQVLKEENFYKRMQNRWLGFEKAYPNFPGILNLLRTAANSIDQNVREKARESYDSIIQPLRDDIQDAVKKGEIREVDPDLFAYILWGIAEHLAFRVNLDHKYSQEQTGKLTLDLTNRIFAATTPDNASIEGTMLPQGTVSDLSGVITELCAIQIGGASTLRAHIGEAEITVNLSDLAELTVRQKGQRSVADTTTRDGLRSSLQIDGEEILSGETPIGTFKVALKRVARISFQR